MKQKLFTFIAMFALVLVANTTFAENETDVLAGNQYEYSLSNIVLTEAATAEVNFSGTNSGNVTIYKADGTTLFGANQSMLASETSLDFQIAYATNADADATDDKIVVIITYNGSPSTCANTIELDINILPLPTYTLAIAVDISQTCQARTGEDNNLADARGTESNTITFTVTPNIKNVPNLKEFTFDYDLTLTDLTSSSITDIAITPSVGTISNTATSDGNDYTTADTYQLTFITTTGVSSETITAALTDIVNNAKLSIADGSTQTYAASSGGDQSASTTISAVPTIGSFQF